MQQFFDATLSGLTSGVIFAAFALCLVLIFRATRIVNFGQGAQAMFTTYLALRLLDNGWPYGLAFVAALVAGFLLGAFVERVIVRPVETGPEINAVIVTLGVFVALVALAAIVFGNDLAAFPAAFGLRGLEFGELHHRAAPERRVHHRRRCSWRWRVLLALFQFTSLGLRMRASAFSQEVARLLGRQGRAAC